ncbi:hypothetical protein IFVP136_C230551 [Vibrio parahaemolyticus]
MITLPNLQIKGVLWKALKLKMLFSMSATYWFVGHLQRLYA